MRRPNVYQRSAPRPRCDAGWEDGADYLPAARAVLGAVTLARHLGQALSEAEGIARSGEDA